MGVDNSYLLLYTLIVVNTERDKMTYAEALSAAKIAISFSSATRSHAKHWNKLDDALRALPFSEFENIYDNAIKGETEADFAIVCMCE